MVLARPERRNETVHMLIAIGVLVAYEAERFVEFEVRYRREAALRKVR